MSCIVQIHSIFRKQGLSQKVWNCSTHHFAFWLAVATDRALQVLGYFL